MNDIKNITKAILKSIRGFDESSYLELNPDVFEAVQKGSIFSGWQHYILYGFGENRPNFPVPPAYLRKRVHGEEALSSFIGMGELLAKNLFDTINGKFELSEQSRILDFGCGCGRVIREFQKSFINSKFYGTDIDREAIIWCQQKIPQIGEFITNKELPPLPFNDEFFDFVYSVSVFTHLPEDMQFEWLDELRRVTKRGGYLILTTHGEELLQSDSEEIRNQFRETGFYYSKGDGTQGLPDFYQTSFHTDEYIRRQWSKFFEIKMIIKKGIASHQDLILCQRQN